MSFDTNRQSFTISSWTEFRKYIDGTYLTLAFFWQETPDIYRILTEEYGGFRIQCTIIKDSGADQTDFESNFKNLAPRRSSSADRIQVYGASGAVPVPVLAGITGTVGVNNFPNNQGITGVVGVTGQVGITGVVGVTGSVSINNYPNNQGVTGVVGIQGPVGITGPALVLQGTPAVLQNAWPVKVTDGTNIMPTADSVSRALFSQITDGSNIVSVKNSGISATGTDRALVVAVSPNNTVSTTNSVSSQVDGHSVSIGSTSDADTANTVIGRLKQIISRLPSALIGGRLDTNIGSWFGATGPTIGQKSNSQSLPVSISSDQVGSVGATAPSQAFPLAAKQNGVSTLRQLSAKYDEVDFEYRLLVDAKSQIVPPTPPPSTTPRTIVPTGALVVNGNSTDTYDYTIPNGVTLTIQQIVSGAEGDPNERGSKITIIYVDASSVEHIVQRIYLQSTTQQITPETSQAVDGTSMVGNGTTTLLRINRTRLGGGNAEIDVVVRGYES